MRGELVPWITIWFPSRHVGVPVDLSIVAGQDLLHDSITLRRELTLIAFAHAVTGIHAFLKISDLRVPPTTSLEQTLHVTAASLLAVGYIAWYVRAERRAVRSRPRSS